MPAPQRFPVPGPERGLVLPESLLGPGKGLGAAAAAAQRHGQVCLDDELELP